MGRKGMPSLEVMKASYRNARDNGDKEEEAKWANQIGHAFKDRGEYVTALDWFRKDYEISSTGSRGLDPGKLMPTCQSIGEVYLRLQNYEDALTYQHKHFHWAEQAGDIVEQQRASTQLGRTYLELYEIKERNSAWPDAKAYFQTSLELARRLRANLPASHTSPSGFVIEQVDAYNNLGLVRALAEDYKEALKFYTAGLNLCDEEEVDENDAARSRIHHNLGRLYAELRDWEKAKYHTELDIEICQKIPHAQGEAKGLMNLADLYFKSQDFEQSSRCHKRALHIAQTLEDEDVLIAQIKSNIEVVGQARAQMKAFDAEMQKLSKLRREVESSKGTAAERKFIKQECALLLELTDLAENLQAWEVHLGLAKRLKKLTQGLGDIEKLGDALEIVASSYYNLRNLPKSIKWHLKGLELCKRIGHLEGQIVSKINYGNALEASGDAVAALNAYLEAFEAAKTGSAKMLPQQISALENIHYCYFIRLERLDDARKVEFQLKELKHARDGPEPQDDGDEDERCSETGSEGPCGDSPMAAASVSDSDEDRQDRLPGRGGPVKKFRSFISDSDEERQDRLPRRGRISKSKFRTSISDSDEDRLAARERTSNVTFGYVSDSDESDDDNTLLSSIKPQIRSQRLPERRGNTSQTKKNKREPAGRPVPVTEPHLQDKHRPQRKRLYGARTDVQFSERKKRVISDDEERGGSLEGELGRRQASKSARRVPLVVEEDDIAVHSGDSSDTGSKGKVRSSTRNDAADHVVLSSDDDMPTVSRKKRKVSNPWSKPSSDTDSLRSPLRDLEDVPPGGNHWLSTPLKFRKAKVAEVGYTGGVTDPIPNEEKSGEAVAETKTPGPKDDVSAAAAATRITSTAADRGPELAHTSSTSSPSKIRQGTRAQLNLVQGWTKTSLLESYLSHCSDGPQFISTNSDLVEKIRYQKVAEEVVVAGCNMQDSDARPLLAALGESDAFSQLDMSHNRLGNATVHAIQELIKSTDQADLGLTLDLHCNNLGAGALLEICRCPVSLSRLEVLNLSGNRLTDAAARHLSKILKESQALATLNLESCSLTTRAITQLTSSLHPQSPLNKLCIGNNTPIASHAIQELLHQLSSLAWFSHLDLKGIELDGAAVACLCTFLEKSKSITSLILQNTAICNDGAVSIADALSNPSHCLEKLDLSMNCFNEDPATKLCARVMSLQRLSNLNLSGNDLGTKAAEVLAQGLARPDCRLKALDISNCHLGQPGVLLIMHSLKGHTGLLNLNLAENIVPLQSQLPPSDNSASSANSPVEVSDGDAGIPPESESSTKIRVSAEEYCRLLERELAAADAHHSGATSTDDGREGVQQQSEETREGKLLSPKAESSSLNCKDRDPEPISARDYDATDGLAQDLDPGMKSTVGPGPVQPEAAAGPDAETSRPDSSEEGALKSEPADMSRKDVAPVARPPVIDRQTEPGTSSATTTISAGSAFCERLAASIRMARGLQQLDLSKNAIDRGDIDVLYLAWSACPRSGSSGNSSDPGKHIDGDVLHFYIEGRPCPCADPPCCAAR